MLEDNGNGVQKHSYLKPHATKKNFIVMMSLDIFLSSLSKKKHQEIIHELSKIKGEMHPLLSWDIIGMYSHIVIKKANKADDLKKLQRLHTLFDWKTDLKKILSNEYYVLVLTDLTATVQWVNSDFKNMTGYSEKHIIGKSPKILQGKNTSTESRKSIRDKLFLGESFKEVVVNYRRNKQEYICLINIFPIKNVQDQITHFLALEKEVLI